MAKYNICTNFYSNYLYKGLSLYYSLEKKSKNFCLWILCMDKETFKVLSDLSLKHAKLIDLKTVENQELAKIKRCRNMAEYSWTLKSSFMSFLFKKYPDVPNIFYLDADVFFFKDVRLVYDDLGNSSLAIAPHRFPKSFGFITKTSGIFNAGVIYIKRDDIGLKALEKWKKQCLDWCYQKPEGGKYGDQKYLDEWPKLYKNLHQFQNSGINLAPWNVGVHKISKKGDKIFVDRQPLVFYHFHALKIYSDLTFDPSYGYRIPKVASTLIYKDYENVILDLIKKLDNIDPELKLDLEKKNTFEVDLQKIKRLLLPVYWRIRTILDH